MKISSLKPGMVVYHVGRQRMGNTTMSRSATWTVRIEEIAEDGKSVIASWNGNRVRRYYEGDVKRWRLSLPKAVTP